ncbi:hypothetical protein [Pseudonocardia sp. TRM90224]|uniref:hypothetical protein n=1 Tax=Pseudonocardia sp. TRM90224 TaxID=2812678 RepID=UPI001E2DE34D|nr:hypothetical protein [Pseudonocardia sp. TRM90224]
MKMSRWRYRVSTVVGTAAVLLALLTAPATAEQTLLLSPAVEAGPYTVVWSAPRLAQPRSVSESEVAVCPEGTVVLGGGSANNSVASSGALALIRSEPVMTAGRLAGWAARVENFSLIGWNFTAVSVCGPAPGGHGTVARFKEIAPNAGIGESFGKFCPNRAQAVSGGFAIPAGVRAHTVGITHDPAGHGPSVGVINRNPTTITASAFAICADTMVISHGPNPPAETVASQTQKSLTVRCPEGMFVVGGGVEPANRAAITITASYPSGASEWTVVVLNDETVAVRVVPQISCVD